MTAVDASLVTVDPLELRRVFGGFPSGVAALSANVAGQPSVLVASSFQVGVSLDPPMVLFSVQKSSTTWPLLRSAERIGVSILSTSHAHTVRQLASADRSARLEGIEYASSEKGAVFIAGASAWLECEITHDYDAGDHRIIVFTVIATDIDEEAAPLVFHRSGFHGLSTIVAG